MEHFHLSLPPAPSLRPPADEQARARERVHAYVQTKLTGEQVRRELAEATGSLTKIAERAAREGRDPHPELEVAQAKIRQHELDVERYEQHAQAERRAARRAIDKARLAEAKALDEYRGEHASYKAEAERVKALIDSKVREHGPETVAGQLAPGRLEAEVIGMHFAGGPHFRDFFGDGKVLAQELAS
jgi:hypothetical protein